MDNFVKAQKRYLDILAEETSKALRGKPVDGVKKSKKTELSEIARQATESFIEVQKRLVDVAGKQMNAKRETAQDARSPATAAVSPAGANWRARR